MTTTSIILFIVALVLAIIAWRKYADIKICRSKLDARATSLDNREAAWREAMKRNGAARLELDKREGDFNLNHKVVSVECVDTQADLDKCPSDLKRLAMAKSRLAHKLGYKVLEVFSDIKVDKDPDGPGDRYRVEFLIQEKK